MATMNKKDLKERIKNLYNLKQQALVAEEYLENITDLDMDSLVVTQIPELLDKSDEELKKQMEAIDAVCKYRKEMIICTYESQKFILADVYNQSKGKAPQLTPQEIVDLIGSIELIESIQKKDENETKEDFEKQADFIMDFIHQSMKDMDKRFKSNQNSNLFGYAFPWYMGD